MSMDNNVVYDRICIGRFSPFYILDGKRFNEAMTKGVSCETYMKYQKNSSTISFTRGRNPYQVYEYCVDGVWYRRAFITPVRSSGIFYMSDYGQPVVVLFSSRNPGMSVINKSMPVDEAMKQYSLTIPEAEWVEPNNDEMISSNNQNVEVINAYKQYEDYKVTALEIAALVSGIVAFFTGMVIWIVPWAAGIISLVSLLKPKRNRNMAVLGMVFAGVGIIESFMGLFGVLYMLKDLFGNMP